jgi:glycosyltransferase involved in cell wall biosynthesis
LLDLSESNGRPVDRLIVTKFPTYFARHPHKVAWLIHQYRAAYELAGTPYSDFSHTDFDVDLRRDLIDLDTRMLNECERRFANSGNTAARARRFNGVAVEALYHPPRLAPRLRPGVAGDYVLSVGRLESVKRVDLVLRGFAAGPRSLRLVVAGDGTMRRSLEALAADLGIESRVQFLGEVDDDGLVELYAGALAVIYPPYDEDYGYVTLEAFLAAKPVITTTDSGGPHEFVADDVNGHVTAPEPGAIGAALAALEANRARAAAMGAAGLERARTVTWDGVIERLVG